MKTLFIAASLAALGLANPASAQSAPVRVSVSTAGLDLSTAAGQRALDLRILHAASALCGTPSPVDVRARAGYDECRAQARLTAAVERNRLIALASQQGVVEVAARR